MTNKDYHDIPAINHSFLVAYRRNILKGWKYCAFNPLRETPDDKDSLVFGNLYHTLVQFPNIVSNYDEYRIQWEEMTNLYNEQLKIAKIKKDVPKPVLTISVSDDIQIVIFDFGQNRVNKGYEKFANSQTLLGDDDLIVSWTEFEQVITMLRCLFVHPVYTRYSTMEVINVEEPIMWTDDKGTKWKIKPDKIYKAKNGTYYVIDYKTFKQDFSQLVNRAQELGYPLQEALLRRGVTQKYGISQDNIVVEFICQSIDEPLIICPADNIPEAIAEENVEIDVLVDDFNYRLKEFNSGNAAAFVPIIQDPVSFRFIPKNRLI